MSPEDEKPTPFRLQQPPPADQGFGFQPPSNPDPLKAYEATTARNLAYILVSMLAVSIVVQYVALGYLAGRNLCGAIPNFEHLFNAWLPVIAGLSSSAVTFYLTREKK
jgi:hypothetical protein